MSWGGVTIASFSNRIADPIAARIAETKGFLVPSSHHYLHNDAARDDPWQQADLISTQILAAASDEDPRVLSGHGYAPLSTFWTRASAPLSQPVVSMFNAASDGDWPAHDDVQALIDLRREEFRQYIGNHWLVAASFIATVVGEAGNAGHDAKDRFGAEARVQFLIATCLDLEWSLDAKVGVEEIAESMTFANEVFELELLLSAIHFPGKDFNSTVGRRLRMEAVNDRFEFYGRHGRRIKEATADQIADEFSAAVGWNIDEYWRVAEAASLDSNERRKKQASTAQAYARMNSGDFAASDGFVKAVQTRATLSHFSVVALARGSGVSAKRVKKLLDDLSLRPIKSVVNARDESPLRTFSVVPLGNDTYFVPFPHLWPQDTFRVVNAFTSSNPQLKERWLKARDDGTVRLVAEALGQLFGVDRVKLESKHIGIDGSESGETDVIVELGDDALIVECKAHAMTPSGRRGAPARIEKKTKEILETGFSQVLAGKRHLIAGLKLRQHRGSEFSLTIADDAVLPSMVVSFERIDPMFTGMAKRDFASERILPVNIADFLSMCDLLTSPSSFVSYVAERSRMLDLPNLDAITEMEYLAAAVIEDSLGSIADLAVARPDVEVIVDGLSLQLNPILAVPLEKFRPPRMLNPPPLIVEALTLALDERVSGWTRASIAVHRVPPAEWRPVKKLLRKIGRTGIDKKWESADGSVKVISHIIRRSSTVVPGPPHEIHLYGE